MGRCALPKAVRAIAERPRNNQLIGPPVAADDPPLDREQARSCRIDRCLPRHPEYQLAIGSAAMPFVGASLLANGHLHRPPPRSAPHLVREQARSYRTGRWLAWHTEQSFGLNLADRPFVGASLLANGHLRRPAPWSSLHLVREQARSYRIGRWLAWHTEQSFGLNPADRPFVGVSVLANGHLHRPAPWSFAAPRSRASSLLQGELWAGAGNRKNASVGSATCRL